MNNIIRCLFLIFVCGAVQAQQSVSILVDVSGSMKKNDPKNLRQPAVKLLTLILPKGIYGQIINFSTTTKQLVPLKSIDNRWRQQGINQLHRIHSRGRNTNIRSVLLESMMNLPKDSDDNIFILLTDGKVDVEDNRLVNSLERKRIIHETIEKLTKRKVKVHSIALSEDADHELLKLLSQRTGGLYEKASNARELEHIFYRLFNSSVDSNELSIDKNQRFKVDNRVQELTVLIKDWEGKFQLLDPNGKNILDSSSKRFKVYQTNNFTLITLNKPTAGYWQIIGPKKGNRAFVFSQLRIKVHPIPNRVYQNQLIKIKLSLVNGEELVTEPLLLEKSRAYLRINGETIEIPRSKEIKGDYKLNHKIEQVDKKGLIEIVLQSKTFERIKRQLIELKDSIYSIQEEEQGVIILVHKNNVISHVSVFMNDIELDNKSKKVMRYELKPDDFGCGVKTVRIEFVEEGHSDKTVISQAVKIKCRKEIKNLSIVPIIPKNKFKKNPSLDKNKGFNQVKHEVNDRIKKEGSLGIWYFSGTLIVLIIFSYGLYKYMRRRKRKYIEYIKREVK